MFDRSCSAVTWSYHDALGVFCCVRPHCREGSFCTCLSSIRVVHVLDEHVWLEINALIGISEGNSAKGPQLHVPAQQRGSRALTIYRALHNKQAAGPWQFIALFVDDCGKCEFWVILKDLSSRPDVCPAYLLHPYELQPKFVVIESSIRGIFILRKLSRSMENDTTLFKKR